MFAKLKEAWRSWSERRRQNRAERAFDEMEKAGGKKPGQYIGPQVPPSAGGTP